MLPLCADTFHNASAQWLSTTWPTSFKDETRRDHQTNHRARRRRLERWRCIERRWRNVALCDDRCGRRFGLFVGALGAPVRATERTNDRSTCTEPTSDDATFTSEQRHQSARSSLWQSLWHRKGHRSFSRFCRPQRLSGASNGRLVAKSAPPAQPTNRRRLTMTNLRERSAMTMPDARAQAADWRADLQCRSPMARREDAALETASLRRPFALEPTTTMMMMLMIRRYHR